MPDIQPQDATVIEEVPEEVQVVEVLTEEGPKQRTVKKKVIKKRKGGKQEETEITIVEEEGKKPETTVTISEVEIPKESVEMPEETVTVEELPEEISVIEEFKEGGPRKTTIKKKIIRKRTGSKQEATEILTVEEEGKKPLTTVTVEEIELPEEYITELPTKPIGAMVVEELPEEINVIETKTEEGKPTKKIVKKRLLKTRKGSKDEITKIVTIEEEGKKPETTVTIEEIEVPEDTLENIPSDMPVEPSFIEELPEEIKIIEVIPKEGSPKKQVVKKKVIKKRKGGKEEVTEILTIEEEGMPPQTTVTIEETDIPTEIVQELPTLKPSEAVPIIELPTEVTVLEEVTEEGKPKKTTIKKKVIKKPKGTKEEVIEIVTVQEEGKRT
ncbi:hypothetical protein NQ318_016824 [Aromia moschata]|uniref:Titin n=1 Tax=Aromia moschata TaxID=1265417 RepID=A0AAV8YTT9_9CUCU|nr:hypothetical protein NQ318_016824 [Aromia moschata]